MVIITSVFVLALIGATWVVAKVFEFAAALVGWLLSKITKGAKK